MTMSQWKLIGGAVIAVILTGLLATQVTSCRKKQATNAQTQADIAKGEADAHQAQAKDSDAKVADLQAKVASHEADLGRLTEERNALLRKLATKPKPNVDPTVPVDPIPDPLGDVRDEIIAKDAQVIEGQGFVIQSQKIEIIQLTESRDQWKSAAEFREKQALAQEAASKAWAKAVTSSRWRGRVEGFAAGAVIGFLGAKR